jgi:Protein kinase domain
MSVNHDSTLIGRTLGRFEILNKLGAGGMGVVYKARDTHLDRLVAIKILPPSKAGDRDRRLRFAQEAKSASALNHPGIVTIHDIAQHEGIDFIAMRGHRSSRPPPASRLGSCGGADRARRCGRDRRARVASA